MPLVMHKWHAALFIWGTYICHVLFVELNDLGVAVIQLTSPRLAGAVRIMALVQRIESMDDVSNT